MKSWPSKDPDEVLDYGFDWSPRGLDTDRIITSTAVPQEGSAIVDDHTIDPTGQITTTWLSGGTDGQKCTILLTAMTQLGRTLEETMAIKIKTR